jgi:hypothetical protein
MSKLIDPLNRQPHHPVEAGHRGAGKPVKGQVFYGKVAQKLVRVRYFTKAMVLPEATSQD